MRARARERRAGAVSREVIREEFELCSSFVCVCVLSLTSVGENNIQRLLEECDTFARTHPGNRVRPVSAHVRARTQNAHSSTGRLLIKQPAEPDIVSPRARARARR